MIFSMLRVLFLILIFIFVFHAPYKSFSEGFPKVLSCVKGQSDDFDLHVVTITEQNEEGMGEAYVNEKLFKLVFDDGIWLGSSKKGTEFLILQDEKIKIISGKTDEILLM